MRAIYFTLDDVLIPSQWSESVPLGTPWKPPQVFESSQEIDSTRHQNGNQVLADLITFLRDGLMSREMSYNGTRWCWSDIWGYEGKSVSILAGYDDINGNSDPIVHVCRLKPFQVLDTMRVAIALYQFSVWASKNTVQCPGLNGHGSTWLSTFPFPIWGGVCLRIEQSIQYVYQYIHFSIV